MCVSCLASNVNINHFQPVDVQYYSAVAVRRTPNVAGRQCSGTRLSFVSLLFSMVCERRLNLCCFGILCGVIE